MAGKTRWIAFFKKCAKRYRNKAKGHTRKPKSVIRACAKRYRNNLDP